MNAETFFRFWSKVTIGDDCWEWQAGKIRGYGFFYLNGRDRRASHVSLELFSGKAPKDKPHALHSCDNPPCVNPKHLRWGSHSENIKEAFDKGRAKPLLGASHPSAKLNEDQVGRIRAEFAAGDVTKTALGLKYGVHRSLVARIISGKNWKHI